MKNIGVINIVVLLQLILLAGKVQADDPLDRVDGTEEWDQTAEPMSVQAPETSASFQKELIEWETGKKKWQLEQEGFLSEKNIHTQVSKVGKPAIPKTQPGQVKKNFKQGPDKKPKQQGTQIYGSSNALDKAIENELDTTGAVPKVEVDSFKTIHNTTNDNGPKTQTLTPAQPSTNQQKNLTPQDPVSVENTSESEAGSNAAKELLQQQDQETGKEEDELRRKAELRTDEEGQIIDPEIRKEIEKDQ